MRRSLVASCFGFLVLVVSLPPSASAQGPATVTVRLIDTLSTGSSQPGDTFTATLATPLVVNDLIVAEKGTRITGQVLEVISSRQAKGPALITLSLKTVHRPDKRTPLQTGDLTIKAGSHTSRNLLIIGGAVGTGAAIGGAAGGGRGAAIGAATGAGAGAVGVYLTRKQEIVLPSGTVLTFHVTSIVISPEEVARLQRAAHQEGQVHPIVIQRRHHDEDEEEYEVEVEFERPEKIEVEFEGHEAEIKIRWPRRIERLTLEGDNLDEIIEELAGRTGLSAEFLRAKIQLQAKD